MTADLIDLLKRATKAMDDIGCRAHEHSRSCPARQAGFAPCTCDLEDEEEELVKVLKELNQVIKENE